MNYCCIKRSINKYLSGVREYSTVCSFRVTKTENVKAMWSRAVDTLRHLNNKTKTNTNTKQARRRQRDNQPMWKMTGAETGRSLVAPVDTAVGRSGGCAEMP